jgi:hypothetical protein
MHTAHKYLKVFFNLYGLSADYRWYGVEEKTGQG